MPASSETEVAGLLSAVRRGDRAAWERLVVLVHADLKRIAHLHLRRRGRGETLHTTALVNEAYFRLARPAGTDARDRVHFLAIASRAMRQVLVDRARARRAAKRGGGIDATGLDGHEPAAADERGDDLLALEGALLELEQLEPRLGQVVEMRFFGGMTFEEVGEALERLAKLDERQARVVELRYFGGLSVDEAAEVLGLSKRTVEAEWTHAKAWLLRELSREAAP